MGLLPYRLALLLSTRSLVLQREVPKSGPWKGFLGAPAAAKAAVGYLEHLLPRPHPKPFRDPSSISPLNGARKMGHFLLHRPVARRPAQEDRSAARGISTGVTSRRTGGRAHEVGQTVGFQVQGGVQVPVHLQAAGFAAEDPLGEGHLPVQMPAAGAESGRRETSWSKDQSRSVPLRLVLQHPQESTPPHVGDRPGERAPGKAFDVQVLHHDDRLGSRQPGGLLVQEVPAEVLHLAVKPRQGQGGLLAVVGALLLAGELFRAALEEPELLRQGLRGIYRRAIGKCGEGRKAQINTHHVIFALSPPWAWDQAAPPRR
jgi:hypothetical protein